MFMRRQELMSLINKINKYLKFLYIDKFLEY